jgi:hypothetical protein
LINLDEFAIPTESLLGKKMALANAISAIQLVRLDDGGTKLGLLAQIAAGAVIEVCGHGFNERTTKVRMQDQYFFVYLQDLEIPRSLAASA